MVSSCPLCRSDGAFVLQRTEPLTVDDNLVESTLARPGDVISILACTVCGLVFRTPRPTPAELGAYYDKLPAREPKILEKLAVTRAQADRRNDARYAELFKEVRSVDRRANGHIIDVGGWDGRALLPWQAAGWQATLVDPGIHTRTLAATGIRAVVSVDAALQLAHPEASVLTSYHVVEHLDDIASSLREIRLLSRVGTLWVIEVPFDIISLRGLLRSKPLPRTNFHEEHLNFFTPRSLRSTCHILGLRCVSLNIVITQYLFGPTVALRLYARDEGGAARGVERPAYRSPRALRASLRVQMPIWRRYAGLKFRYYKLRHPDPAAGMSPMEVL